MFRLTPIVKNLVVINAGVFIIWYLSQSSGFPDLNFMAEYFMLFKSDLLFERTSSFYYGYDFFNPVQIITHFFSHNRLYHILFNMLALASLGPVIEIVVGSKRFLRFYLFTGIIAGILIAFLDPSDAPVLGASGAISGVLAAFAYMNPNANLRFMFVISLTAKQLAIGVAVLSILLVIAGMFGKNTGGISHFGHLAGMIAAVIYFYAEKAFPFLRN